MKLNILFLELGTSGIGGSFRSLKDHIEIMRPYFDTILVVLANPSVHEDDYKRLGCHVIRLNHSLYTRHSCWIGIYNILFSIARRLHGRLALWVQIFFEFRFSNHLCELIKRYQIEIIHLNNQPMRNFSGFIAANKVKIPVISHIRTLNTFGFSPLFFKFISKIQTSFIAISNAVKEVWAGVGVEANLISVNYNPVLVSCAPKSAVKKFDFIYVGRLIERKGLLLLLEAAHILKEKISFKLAVVGEGALKNKLLNLTQQKQLVAFIEFLGYQRNPLSYIAASNVLVMPSENEGLGRVIIEGMKLRVPVIANAIGGMTEIISDKETGLLFNNTADDLAEKMLFLYTHLECQQRLTERAYLYVQSHFSEKNYRENIYKKISHLLEFQ